MHRRLADLPRFRALVAILLTFVLIATVAGNPNLPTAQVYQRTLSLYVEAKKTGKLGNMECAFDRLILNREATNPTLMLEV